MLFVTIRSIFTHNREKFENLKKELETLQGGPENLGCKFEIISMDKFKPGDFSTIVNISIPDSVESVEISQHLELIKNTFSREVINFTFNLENF